MEALVGGRNLAWKVMVGTPTGMYFLEGFGHIGLPAHLAVGLWQRFSETETETKGHS